MRCSNKARLEYATLVDAWGMQSQMGRYYNPQVVGLEATFRGATTSLPTVSSRIRLPILYAVNDPVRGIYEM